VNRALAAVSAFALFRFDAFSDPVYARLRRSARVRTSFFTEAGVERTTVGPRLRQSDPEMSLLSASEIELIVDACQKLRDKLIFSMLYETGMRIGQLLLLRHSDIHVPKSTVRVQRHPLVPGVDARNKSTQFADVPVPPGIVKLYAAYMGAEYKFIDSDFVFVNLWAGRAGEPMKYASIEQLVLRLRVRSGVDRWSAHTFRHSYVTRLLASGVPTKTVSYLVTHSSVATTLDLYDHVNVEDIRRQLLEAGIWSDANS
jgi:integrase